MSTAIRSSLCFTERHQSLCLDVLVANDRMRKQTTTWVVVADGARGRFFKPNEDLNGPSPLGSPTSSHHKAGSVRNLKSDKRPTLQFFAQRRGHALEPPHDYHKLEKHRFMATLAEALTTRCKRRGFDELYSRGAPSQPGRTEGLALQARSGARSCRGPQGFDQ